MDGYRFYVNVGEPLGIEPYFFGHSGAVWLTHSLVRPGDLCVDAGANAGHYTFVMASIVGSKGRVYSFEPNPEFSTLLKRSSALNGFEDRVQVIEAALWSSTKEVAEFHVSDEPGNSGTSSLVNHGWFPGGSHPIGVRTTTLDAFASDNEIARFRLVKVDVERAEDAVLEGARRLLAEARVDYLIVELHRGGRAETILGDAGYEGHLLLLDEQRLRPLREVPDRWFGDYLFRRPGLAAPG
jgi:FkbM family methyltransferase